jgi:hypothetical protein
MDLGALVLLVALGAGPARTPRSPDASFVATAEPTLPPAPATPTYVSQDVFRPTCDLEDSGPTYLTPDSDHVA